VYKLVIAEKPSVAQAIAKVIGAIEKKDGFLEGNGYLVSWCVGHLIELAQPEFYDEKYARWRHEDLPIFPTEWKYQISMQTKKQFEILKKLMHRKDVESLIEATDAGREGELIFRLVYHMAGCTKPFERLWISSMEDRAIALGFVNLKAGVEYDSLFEAALCRERADWIVGMNATRLFSTLYGQTLNVGRVMTPTLAMLVTREAEISGFKPETFYTVVINVGGIQAVSDRFMDQGEAKKLSCAVMESKKATVSKLMSAEKKESPPLLYDLTSLQRDANKRMGFTAQQTLDYAQSLYEKKLITYPRTDSKYLSEDMLAGLQKLVAKTGEKFGITGKYPDRYQQVINDKKVTDHHAIIPTVNVADVSFGELPSGEQKILSLIAARLLAAVGENCITSETEVLFQSADQIFKAKAKKIVKKGFYEVLDWIFGKSKEEEEDAEQTEPHDADKMILQSLDLLKEGAVFPVQSAECKEGKTTPKKHFTEDTLLAAMEHAGGQDMPEEAEHQGIGTPATRAGTIEKLVRVGFVERKGSKKTKYLIPTHKGTALITVIPEEIQSPAMTADWEEKLIGIEHGKYSGNGFMEEICSMITEMIRTYKVIEGAEVLMKPLPESVGKCPCCGKRVMEKAKGFFCEDRNCGFALWKENYFFSALNKKITKQIAEQLLKNGKANLKGCRNVKTGKTYDATVHMNVDDEKRTQFSLNFDKGGGKK